MMDPALLAGGAAAGNAAARRGGLMDLLSPLDYPRQALANLGRGVGRLVSGEGDWSDLAGAMPGALGVAGGVLGGALGLPGILTGSALGGMLQGAGKATGSDAFEAPSPQDVANTLGMDQGNPMLAAIAGAATDPLSYTGLGMGRQATPAMSAAQQAGQATPQVAGEVRGSVEQMYNQLLAKASESAALGQGGQDAGRVQQAVQSLPGSGLGPIPGMNQNPIGPGDTMRAALDPRNPYVQYTPQATAGMPPMPGVGEMRSSGQDLPGILEALENSGTNLSAGAGAGPRGRLSYLGQQPPAGIEIGAGGWARPPAQLPPVRGDLLEIGQVPPSLREPTLAEALTGMEHGNAVSMLTGLGGNDAMNMRRMLAGVGEGGQHVMDLPMQQASALLGQQGAQSSTDLQALLQQIAGLTGDQRSAWQQLYPHLPPGSAPAAPARIGSDQLNLLNYGMR